MGYSTLSNSPEIPSCPDGCSTLPSTLNARVTSGVMLPFTCVLDQNGIDDCFFEGNLVNGVDPGSGMTLTFCHAGQDAEIVFGLPMRGWCGGCTVVNNKCNPWITTNSDLGCLVEVWP